MKNLHTKRSMKRKLIWVSWFGNCQSIKTDGGRRFTEGLYQTLISFHLARRNVIYRAKPSQVTWWSIKEAGSKGEICHVHFLLKSHWITVSSIWDRVIWVFWVESTLCEYNNIYEDDVMAWWCLYLMNKMRSNLINLRWSDGCEGKTIRI